MPDETLQERKEQSMWCFLIFKSVFYKNRKLSKRKTDWVFRKGRIEKKKADANMSATPTFKDAASKV